MKKFLTIAVLSSLAWTMGAEAATPIRILKSKYETREMANPKLVDFLTANIDQDQFREIRAQMIYNENRQPDHVVVYLHSKQFHRVDYAMIPVKNNEFTSVLQNYHLTAADHAQQPGITKKQATCPDTTVQFIAFAPNDDSLEQSVTKEVATEAKAKNLKTVELYITDATRDAYLNYMSCPNVLGNFYDGDANPQSIVTNDGEIDASDFSTTLKGAWQHKMTNIWLACEAYNDPMLSAVQKDAQARKYAAGVNDLEVGPSDKAGACAMEAAIDGKPMTAAFQSCYKQYDNSSDQWGFGGDGTDSFYN